MEKMMLVRALSTLRGVRINRRGIGVFGWRELSSGGGKVDDENDSKNIRRAFTISPESPQSRRLTLEAKLRMIRFLDKVYDSNHQDAQNEDRLGGGEHDDSFDRYSRFAKFDRRNVDFEEFLIADKDGDGRVSSAEWERFLQKKAMMESGMDYEQPNALNIEIPLSTSQLHSIAEENDGLHISVNGMRYRLCLEPEGKTADIIKSKQDQLEDTLVQLANMEVEKRPLDSKASRHTKRVLTGGLFYLLMQAGVIAKLTFFSRFGWDVMEPITYFITFGTAIMGFVFFQYHKIEYSYPALAALLTQRKASRLYTKYGFDINRYIELQALAVKYEKQLLVLHPPRTLMPSSNLELDQQEEEEVVIQQENKKPV